MRHRRSEFQPVHRIAQPAGGHDQVGGDIDASMGCFCFSHSAKYTQRVIRFEV
jgi:hypothetical protein